MNALLARQLNVLIVDYNRISQSFLRSALESLGFVSIDIVDSAQEAIRLQSAKRYDMIFCQHDLKQPREGYFLLQQLCDEKRLGFFTAFILISAERSQEIVRSIIDLQPDEFIAQPFTIKELDKRVTRISTRHQTFNRVYKWLEKERLPAALSELDALLQRLKPADESYQVALKLKGETLLADKQYQEAKRYYSALAEKHNFSWIQAGLIKCLLQLGEEDEAEKRIIALAMRPDALMTGYDLLTMLQIKQEYFDDALECMVIASGMAPQNLHRYEQVIALARVTHDYEQQFQAAKKLLSYAKQSVYHQPGNYLRVARAGIDLAMTVDEQTAKHLVKESQQAIKELATQFPGSEHTDEVLVIGARICSLENDEAKARALLDALDNNLWRQQDTEALLDRAKAFHEAGLQETALSILDIVEQRCLQDATQNQLLIRFVQRERSEKSDIRLHPKALNNQAVTQYQRGDITAALTTLRQAFRVMPKNPAIAINLLQALLASKKTQPTNMAMYSDVITSCQNVIENNALTDEQKKRYARIKALLAAK